jgi:hypothetical protein
MAAKEISVKKYVVRLSGEERERLETVIRKGNSPAQRLLKARILLKGELFCRHAGQACVRKQCVHSHAAGRHRCSRHGLSTTRPRRERIKRTGGAPGEMPRRRARCARHDFQIPELIARQTRCDRHS